jgi:hypothetical protein
MFKCYRYLMIVLSDYENMLQNNGQKCEEECVERLTHDEWWLSK